ncbi:WYL domain-containing protein [Rhodococcus sp. H29-C3]|uniref:helix-turn-helix transcriptional regulator n=1 Tax=Rhodococcus sp. H29-C3 TaxID=3046307 RepID=UPI0024BBD806|nr:WYL domain-containing protein [Rhodococcus sp. H29-C3]MDJ0362320.1 WYL domain-containing protein [Rhodococcus sp. H29-C3]
MSEIASRTLEILSLFQSQKEWTGNALSERLDVSPRTVRRDVMRLRDLGYSVDADRGPGGFYRLATGSHLPPLIFDDEQAVAIALALQTAPSSVQGMNDATARALQTVRDLLPPHLADRLQTFAVEQIDNVWDLAPPKVPSDMIALISSAAQDKQLIKFDYQIRSAQSVQDSQVVAEPHKLVVWSGRWYLIAYGQREESWHAFRLDRVRNIGLPGWRFRPREFPEDDVTRFVQLQPDRGDLNDAWPCRGTVRMVCPVELVAKWAPGGANIESIGEETTRITMGAWSWSGLLGLLATFGCNFVVEEPAELAEAAAVIARRMTHASQGIDAKARS